MTITDFKHKTVLLEESISLLHIKAGDIFVDGTLGAGGHSLSVCEKFGNSVRVIGIDADADAIERAKKRIDTLGKNTNFTTSLSNFREIKSVLDSIPLESVDKILLDLGLSSDQLETSGRGFTFQKDEPLLMTFKKNPTEEDTTAMDIVNNWNEENITAILKGFGEERYAYRIARAIVVSRENRRIERTSELVEIIKAVVPAIYRNGRIHFATKTFQALRIAVNDELGALEQFLNDGWQYLNKGGRMAVISFHSAEDRKVKIFFKEKSKEGIGLIITKRPVCPTQEEININRRARSAKLRVIQKISVVP